MARIGNMTPAEFCLGETTNTARYFKERRRENKHFFSSVLHAYFHRVTGSYSATAFMDVLDVIQNDTSDWLYLVEYIKKLQTETTDLHEYEQRIRFLNAYASRYYDNSLPKIDRKILFKVVPKFTRDSEFFKKTPFWSSMMIKNTLTSQAIGMLINHDGININSLIERNNFILTSSTIAKTYCNDMIKAMDLNTYKILIHNTKFNVDNASGMLYKLKRGNPDLFISAILDDFKNRFKETFQSIYGKVIDDMFDANILTPDLIFKDNFDDAIDLISAHIMINLNK